MNKRKIAMIAISTASALVLLVAGLTACNSSGSSGDYMEAGYNIDGGQQAIGATGSVTVAHGLNAMPTSVVITQTWDTTTAIASGSATIYVMGTPTATTFIITGYTFNGGTGGWTKLGAASTVSWTALTE